MIRTVGWRPMIEDLASMERTGPARPRVRGGAQALADSGLQTSVRPAAPAEPMQEVEAGAVTQSVLDRLMQPQPSAAPAAPFRRSLRDGELRERVAEDSGGDTPSASDVCDLGSASATVSEVPSGAPTESLPEALRTSQPQPDPTLDDATADPVLPTRQSLPPAVTDDWISQRQSALAQAHAELRAAVPEASAAGARQWAAHTPSAAMQQLAQLYGFGSADDFVAQRPDVVELIARSQVGANEGDPPAGQVMAGSQELASLDAFLYSPMAQVLMRQLGTGPAAPATSAVAREQVRRLGSERYAMLVQLDRAYSRVQQDFARALEQARQDPSAAGWLVPPRAYTKQVPTDYGYGRVGPPMNTVTVHESGSFSVSQFSQWYNAQQSVSNQAFAALYGQARERSFQVTMGPPQDPSQTWKETRIEVRVGANVTSDESSCKLDGDHLVADGFVHVDPVAPPDLHSSAAVGFDPALGWQTQSQNIDSGSDWFDTFATGLLVGIVGYVTFGAGTAMAGGMGLAGGSLGAMVVGGAVAGGATTAVMGAANGDFSWEHVLEGMGSGAVAGALSYGANAASQAVADSQLAAGAAAQGGQTSFSATVPPTNGYQYGQGVQIQGVGSPAVAQQIVQDAQNVFNGVHAAASVVQGGLMADASGGDFGDGAISGLSTLAGQVVADGASQALGAADGGSAPGVTRFAGGVLGAGAGAALVNANGGDGDSAFIHGVVQSALGSLTVPAQGATTAAAGGGADEQVGMEPQQPSADATGVGAGSVPAATSEPPADAPAPANTPPADGAAVGPEPGAGPEAATGSTPVVGGGGPPAALPEDGQAQRIEITGRRLQRDDLGNSYDVDSQGRVVVYTAAGGVIALTSEASAGAVALLGSVASSLWGAASSAGEWLRALQTLSAAELTAAFLRLGGAGLALLTTPSNIGASTSVVELSDDWRYEQRPGEAYGRLLTRVNGNWQVDRVDVIGAQSPEGFRVLTPEEQRALTAPMGTPVEPTLAATSPPPLTTPPEGAAEPLVEMFPATEPVGPTALVTPQADSPTPDELLLAAIRDAGWPGTGGSGPTPGVIGVNNSTSVEALRNYFPKNGGVEFVYNPATNEFVVGRPINPDYLGSPHEALGETIGAVAEPTLVGGMFMRSESGEFLTTENSGHFGENWNDSVRSQFQRWLSDRLGFEVRHEVWKKP